MYDWLERQQLFHLEANLEIEEFRAKKLKLPLDVKRKYSILTQFYCLAAFDSEQSTVLHLSIQDNPSPALIEELLLHFKEVRIFHHEDQPFELMLQYVRPSSITEILSRPLNPIIEDLFGRKSREIDRSWFPQRGVFEVKAELLENYYDEEFERLLSQLRQFNTTSIVMNTLLNDKRKNSIAFRCLSHASQKLELTVNENNHITLLTFK